MTTSPNYSIQLADFKPVNEWAIWQDGPQWKDGEDRTTGDPRYITDTITGKNYLNESKALIRFKCFLLTPVTPFVHVIASLCNVVYRILKLVTFYHFLINKKGETEYNFKARLADAGKDLLRIITTPFSILALELAAIYGIFNPYDGRKLYASVERVTYGALIAKGHFVLAPCFQPNPYRHLLGADINVKNGI